MYGQIQAAHKIRMRHATADKLVFCHEMMHVQECMQGAGVGDVERWESDSDSDHSCDEDDADDARANAVLMLTM
jgi:hypothetical protein